jgi:hypothetical protein
LWSVEWPKHIGECKVKSHRYIELKTVEQTTLCRTKAMVEQTFGRTNVSVKLFIGKKTNVFIEQMFLYNKCFGRTNVSVELMFW